MPLYEWDENKRHLTLEKHKIDFIDAAEVFESVYLKIAGRSESELALLLLANLMESISRWSLLNVKTSSA